MRIRGSVALQWQSLHLQESFAMDVEMHMQEVEGCNNSKVTFKLSEARIRGANLLSRSSKLSDVSC